MSAVSFEALKVDTLPSRLGGIEAIRERLGDDPSKWRAREVGDGNLNLVFIVEGERGGVVVKQALPYVRLVGESWPLPLKRTFFEYHALIRQEARAPGLVPQVFHFDRNQALIAMEYLTPHVILRRALIDGRQLPYLARDMALFMARTLFRGSDLSMTARERKADLALFADNVELCDITENLVFSDPYFEAEMNFHTSPQLDTLVAELRADRDLKVVSQRMKHIFASRAETMVHGDLHTGAIMVTEDDTRVIDAEFSFYGPMSFDVGMLFANFWMAYFSQAGHEEGGSREPMRAYLLDVLEECWSGFRTEFSRLWRNERNGILYQKSLFEDQGDGLASEQALNEVLHQLWVELLGFAGIEIHRRILGLAHNADFEMIADRDLRARCEARALKFGRQLAVNRARIHSMSEANTLATLIETGAVA